MENIDKILEVLNEALRSKDLEITSLRYQLKRAQDDCEQCRNVIKVEEERIARLEAEITKLTTERGAD